MKYCLIVKGIQLVIIELGVSAWRKYFQIQM